MVFKIVIVLRKYLTNKTLVTKPSMISFLQDLRMEFYSAIVLRLKVNMDTMMLTIIRFLPMMDIYVDNGLLIKLFRAILTMYLDFSYLHICSQLSFYMGF